MHAGVVVLLLASCSSGRAPDTAADGGKERRNGSDEPFDPGEQPDGIVPLPDAGGIETLLLDPADSSVSIGLDEPAPVQFRAAVSSTGAPANSVTWSSDNESVGMIDPTTGLFTPTGLPGTVNIVATSNSLQSITSLRIAVSAEQHGDPDAGKQPEGAGGIGGVGGEGGGTKIEDQQLLAAFEKKPQIDAKLSWLYPYDATVWPRGLPAPLLQWRPSEHEAVAVKLHIEVDDLFRYNGYFGRPVGLTADNPFVRLPIPQRVWEIALSSGKTLRIQLIVAVAEGDSFRTYTPATNPTWTIAPTTLRGAVYYNSYGTKLAENYSGAKGGNGRMGGATLAIRRNAFDPVLVAGATTSDSSGCRVCHSVSADGSRMIVQHANNLSSSEYDLRDGNRERALPATDNGKFGWAALSPDGAIALGNAGPPGSNSQNRASLDHSALYRVADGSVLSSPGLSDFVTQAATPAFSPQGDKLAFNYAAGSGAGLAAVHQSLVVMNVEKVDDSTYSFSDPREVFRSSGTARPGWPYFLPDGQSLVFQLQREPGAGEEHFVTRNGARGELWWTDLDGNAHALDRANGKGYLPTSDAGHADDTTLQFEPTAAPIVAGGYAWVVFTSRRQYGNVAVRDPYESDARSHDLSVGNPEGPTTKKLWVTALDMPPKPGSDPSHPAFYLPAQELYAGNSRGFWVLDACKEKGKNCSGGDECCGGYCRVDPEFGGKICHDVPTMDCAMELEACNVDRDCCQNRGAALSCVAGRCAQLVVF